MHVGKHLLLLLSVQTPIAWEDLFDGRGVIGKMRFTTREMWNAVRQAGGWICVDNDITAGTIRKFTNDQLDRLLASESRTLFVTCFNIGHFDSRYQSKGIAKAMIEFLKQSARERGWRKLAAKSCPDVVPGAALGGHVLRCSAWERQGFHVEKETRISAREAAVRRDVIERILSGKLWPPGHWYMKSGQRNIEKVRELARDPAWRSEYDKECLMAFAL